MQTPEQAWAHQLEMSSLISEVNPLELSPESRAQWFLIQMQGIKFLQAYCLAQDGVCVIWGK